MDFVFADLSEKPLIYDSKYILLSWAVSLCGCGIARNVVTGR